ncbi:MAG: C39 family peptidase [Ruminiclostridium sp.]|nr:C39 family peptidase [Ruminiclostridium sp.]
MASETLSVARLCQKDSRWKDVLLGWSSTDTIGASGCLLTSFTMIYNYWVSRGLYNGSVKTPSEMNTHCKNNGAFSDADLDTATAASTFSFQVDSNFNSQNDVSTTIPYSSVIVKAKSAIAGGKPLLIGVYDPNQYAHFVVAYKYDNSEIYIHDPALYNKTTLHEYITSGFHVYSYRAYKPAN